jgi:phospholipase/lecithinase/hemolysin
VCSGVLPTATQELRAILTTAPNHGYTATSTRCSSASSASSASTARSAACRGWSRDDRYCIDVLDPDPAAQAALDKVALGLLDEHARHCVMGADDAEQADKTDELMAAVARLMRRG